MKPRMSTASVSGINPLPYDFRPNMTHPLYLIRSHLARAIRELAPKLEGRLLDFGCGLKPYRSLFQVDEYIGVDFHGEGLTYSQDAVDVFYDGKSLPFPDASFDSIFTSEVFEHIFNLTEILGELNRVLKVGGKVLITCPFVFPEHEVPSDYARYTSFAMRAMMEEEGFRVLEQRKLGNWIEASTQIRLVYWDKYVFGFLRKVPIVRVVARSSFNSLNNVMAKLMAVVLPAQDEYYLSNVILAEKM